MSDEVIEIIENPFAANATAPNLGPVLYKLYKLRRKSDGLYSSGGSWIGWSKKGKVWNTLSGISTHIGSDKGEFYDAPRASYYAGQPAKQGTKWDDLEIVCLEVRENESDRQEANVYIEGLRQRQKKREEQEKARKARREMESAKVQYERAKKLIEDFQTRYGG